MRKRKQRVLNGETVVANMRKSSPDTALIQWAKQNGLFVRIDRRSKWGNPFAIPQHGDRDEVCDRFDDLLHGKEFDISELKGKVLGCWCHPCRCHGDTLARIANECRNEVTMK